jgi:NAD(P)H-flavin reductase
MTDKLFQRAANSFGSRVTLRAFAEGPYGNIHTLDSYGSVLLFAGGVGITHHVPFVRHLVAGFADGTVAARRVTLVWIIQSPEHLEWIRPWMTSILAMDRRREVLRIKLFVTRPRNAKEIQSPSATVQMFPGRPNIDTLVGMEVENQVGAMGVLVCGNGSLSDDVRRVCRKRQARTHVDYIEESFSW